jgi:hypothetical protein
MKAINFTATNPHPSAASRRTPSPASGGGLGWGLREALP